MSMSQNGLEFLEGHEGNAGMLPAARRLTRDNYGLYNDPAGHCTVGVGHLVHLGPCTRQDINNYRAEYPNGLGRDGALQQLAADLGIAEAAVRQHVNVDLTQEQFDALVSFTFNVGEGNLQISRLLRHINAGQCDGQTITGDFHRFLRAGDNPNALLNRWNAEINLFNNGSY